MIKYLRSTAVIVAFLAVAACSPQTADMTAEDFMKPESASVLEKTLAGCGFVMSTDPRAANCKAAKAAKFALDAKEIGRIRREQVAASNAPLDGGVTVVERSAPQRPVAQRVTPNADGSQRVAQQ